MYVYIQVVDTTYYVVQLVFSYYVGYDNVLWPSIANFGIILLLSLLLVVYVL